MIDLQEISLDLNTSDRDVDAYPPSFTDAGQSSILQPQCTNSLFEFVSPSLMNPRSAKISAYCVGID